ncbi:MAG: sialidase family protein [Verrucomicrobiota bacterium]
MQNQKNMTKARSLLGSLLVTGLLGGCVGVDRDKSLAVAPKHAPAPRVKVVESGESKLRPEECRGIIVGPGVNQPDPFPGWGGFVGWESPIRLKNGTWIVGFNAGYWHASVSTPMQYSPKNFEEYSRMGMPTNIVAPTGGRAMFTRSTDEGKTWSKPETLIDTPADDRHPAFVQLDDGTVLCCFFIYLGDEPEEPGKIPAPHIFFIRSFDNGKTWEKKPTPLGTPHFHETDGPFAKLKDGSVLLAINGRPQGAPDQCGIFRSANRGKTWKLLSIIKAAHDLQECTVAELPDGRWVMMARPEGDISWSSDKGKTWTQPVTFGMRMYAPSLTVLRDGTLVCLHGSYARGGLRVIFSNDGGVTWIAPAKDHGFLVDTSYGYGKPMELPDGTLFISYLATGGHSGSDAQQNAIRCIRLRIRADHSGIDLLPAPKR